MKPVARTLNGNVLTIVNGDLATISAQCAALPVSVSAYTGGVKVTIDHDVITIAQRVREATGTTLPSPTQTRFETPSTTPQARGIAKSTTKNAETASQRVLEPVLNVVKGSVLAPIALRQLPPANRTLPAPVAIAGLLPSGPIVLALSDVKRELSSRHIALVDELDPNYTYFGYGDEVSALARVRRETCDTTLLSLVGKTSSIHIVGVRVGYEAAA